MKPRRPLFSSLLLLAAACAGSPPSAPVAEAAGIVRFDETPPDGAELFERPRWQVGERFVLVSGERLQGELSVAAVDDTGYLLDLGDGVTMRRDLDLGHLGKWTDGGKQALRLMTPVDARYHWPLWLGKRWRCEYLDRVGDGDVLPMQADYLVEGVDTIRVPAGEFRTLRIVRTLRLLADEPYLSRTQITWYAPEPGIEVRHLLGDTLVELVDWQRP